VEVSLSVSLDRVKSMKPLIALWVPQGKNQIRPVGMGRATSQDLNLCGGNVIPSVASGEPCVRKRVRTNKFEVLKLHLIIHSDNSENVLYDQFWPEKQDSL
jgi:hypothetical protein